LITEKRFAKQNQIYKENKLETNQCCHASEVRW